VLRRVGSPWSLYRYAAQEAVWQYRYRYLALEPVGEDRQRMICRHLGIPVNQFEVRACRAQLRVQACAPLLAVSSPRHGYSRDVAVHPGKNAGRIIGRGVLEADSVCCLAPGASRQAQDEK
jgi:hypothetical protein